MTSIKKILVAVDFSDASNNAFKVAIDFAEKFNAQLDVVHFAPIAAMSLPVDGRPMVNMELLEEELAKSKIYLGDYIAKNTKNDIDIVQHVEWGEASSEVNNYANSNGIDLIVIGTHGRTGLQHMVMGSVAESILRHSNVPVVCVRYSKKTSD